MQTSHGEEVKEQRCTLPRAGVSQHFLQRARYEYFSLSSHLVLIVITHLCCYSAKAVIDNR